MRSGFRRSLVGYSVTATKARLEEIRCDLDARSEERAQSLKALASRLEEAQTAVAEVERAIAHQHEEHRSLMGAFEAFFEMRRDIIRRAQREIDSEDARLLSALAQRQVLLGERRALLASFQSDARRLIQTTRDRLAQQGPLMPAAADETAATSTPSAHADSLPDAGPPAFLTGS